MLERRFATSFRGVDDSSPGLIQKDDGTVWLVNPDGSETQLPGGAGALPIWTNLIDVVTINNGTVDISNSYAFALTQVIDPAGEFPSVTSLWLRIVYGAYTGGGEAGVLTITLPDNTAANDQNYKANTGEVSGMWSTGGLGSWDAFGAALWSSVDGIVNVAGAPTFDVGEILIAGMGTFPSF